MELSGGGVVGGEIAAKGGVADGDVAGDGLFEEANVGREVVHLAVPNHAEQARHLRGDTRRGRREW